MEERGLTVDQIIERVLVGRSSEEPYEYNKQPRPVGSTPQQHLWNYQLQAEQTELTARLKQLQLQHKAQKQQRCAHRKHQLQLDALRQQLASVVELNL